MYYVYVYSNIIYVSNLYYILNYTSIYICICFLFSHRIYIIHLYSIYIYLDDYTYGNMLYVHPSRDPENEERRIPDFFAVNLP